LLRDIVSAVKFARVVTNTWPQLYICFCNNGSRYLVKGIHQQWAELVGAVETTVVDPLLLSPLHQSTRLVQGRQRNGAELVGIGKQQQWAELIDLVCRIGWCMEDNSIGPSYLVQERKQQWSELVGQMETTSVGRVGWCSGDNISGPSWLVQGDISSGSSWLVQGDNSSGPSWFTILEKM